MKSFHLYTRKTHGVSLIEVIFSMLILSAGVLAYTQSHSNQIAAGLDNMERQQAALIASDINNMIAAHVNLAGSSASKTDVQNRINSLKSSLESEAKKIAAERGYTCDSQNTPTLKGKAISTANTTSTALQPWVQGLAFCLKIAIPSNQQVDSNYNGVWVQTTIYWQPLKRADNSTDNITISSLVAAL
jgi:Tfp pilus assembly protein PilV